LPVLAWGYPWAQGTVPCCRSLPEAIPGRRVLYPVVGPCLKLSLDAVYCTLLSVLAWSYPWTQGTVPCCRSLPEAIPGRRVLYPVAGPCLKLSLDAGYCTLLPVVAWSYPCTHSWTVFKFSRFVYILSHILPFFFFVKFWFCWFSAFISDVDISLSACTGQLPVLSVLLQ